MAIVRYRKKDHFGYRAFLQVTPTRQLTKCFDHRIDAENWIAEQRKLLREGRHARENPTVQEFSQEWLADVKARQSYATHQRYEAVLRIYFLPLWGRQKLSELDPYKAEQLQIELSRKLDPKTVNSNFGVFQKMLNDAVRWRKLAHNPLASVRSLMEPERACRFLTAAELRQLLRHVQERDKQAYQVYALAAMTGMRLSEIQGLKWDCVSLPTARITVRRIWDSKAQVLKETTKTKTIRVIPISQDLREVLIPLAVGRNPSDFVFMAGERQGGFNFHAAAKVLRRHCRNAGVREIRFHDLRHSFASNFVMAGGNIYDLQRMLGHASVQMTERYSHLSPDHLNGATDILNYGLCDRENVLQLRRLGKSGG